MSAVPYAEQETATRGPSSRIERIVVLVTVVAVVAVWARLRWTGTAPFGSDNDEYRGVAEELLRTGRPVVAGVEATKYPLGYPALLALLDAVGLPVTTAALVLNVGLVAALGWLMARLGADLALGVGVPVVTLSAVAGPGVWGSVFVTMPDLLFLVVVAAVLWRVGRVETARDLRVLVGLAVGLALLKTVGILVAGAVTVALGIGGAVRWRRAVLPLLAAAIVTALHAVANLPFAEHTTGYARTFFLVDPNDATAGEVSVLGLLERLPDRWHLVLRDLELAVVGPHVDRPWSWMLVAALLGAGVIGMWRVSTRRAFVVVLVLGWLPAMAVWPYSSVRFELTLLPVAAIGAGVIVQGAVRWAGRAAPIAIAVVAAATVAVVVADGRQVARDADATRLGQDAVAQDTAATVRWAEDAIGPDDVIASCACRELAYRLDRPVVALGYTRDMAELLATADRAGAEWLVVMPPLYGARGRLELALSDAAGPRLELVHQTATVQAYRLRPAR